ncbi:two-component regulator propeller domain-containing protein [Dysgonomonas sp. 520]|uniref:hybrid sensor histidine kinase/response regulator transcription factor n=1 Tax=Dysgonomonas sp. 520 TaxID=2302931 RepID=UPI0013D70AED|nr:two-component regulator propeller domain-containing protein [Dysgonomonas sp. 520]NDW09638.1 response regulator [Dysgonomonas sp. 520]
MKKYIFSCVFISLFYIYRSVLFGNTPDNINFSQISINDGLSQSTVFNIVQDNANNLWFATYDGLSKYNGYNFTVFRFDPENPNSIASDIVRTLFVDSQNRLWIGTRNGLSRYNFEKETFKNYTQNLKGFSKSQVNSITELENNLLLLGTNNGLILFDTDKENFIPVPGMEDNQFMANAFLHLSGDIWIGLNNGLIIYNKKGKKVTRSISHLEGLFVQSMLQEADDKIWVGTEGSGLFLINDKYNTVKTYRSSKSDPNSICSDFIRSLALDNSGRLWVGTFDGLNIYNKREDNFFRYKNKPLQEGSISQNSIRSIFKDNQGGMWCGSYFGGLNYYHSLNNRFMHMKLIPNTNSLNDNVVSCIVEDADHNLWIGTNDNGVNFYDTKTGKFTYYMNSLNYDNGVESNNIKAIYVDDANGLVYIGTHAGGLSVLNKKTGRIQHFNTNNSSLTGNNIYSIIDSGLDFLWIGTLKGVMRYYPKDNSFVAESDLLDNIFITQIFKDSQNRLWIGKEDGLIIYSPTNKQIVKLDIIENNQLLKTAFVNCITYNNKGEICIGTRSGLYIYSEKDRTLEHYTTKNGLPNNVVYGILDDSLNRLWLSTNKGLVCFTPYSKEFRVYSQNDGIQSNQFNSYSYCKTYDGLMYLGGINGITVFHPEKLVDNPYTPIVTIDKLFLFNKDVMPDDETGILDKAISLTDMITLKANQTSFSLEFVVSNYVSNKHNLFAYKLEGFDEDWIYTTDNRIVTYTNLSDGTYTLLVKAANNDGIWSKEVRTLEIKVLPVWWRTWWAILLFSVAIIAISIIVIRTVWFRKMLKKELKMEQLDKLRQDELNQMKTRFFINLSHELRTPLTLIQSPLEEIMNKGNNDKWMQSQLQYIKKNTNKLMHIINQLIDYRRAELGVFELKVVEQNLNDFAYDNFILYESLAKRKKIDYYFDSEITDRKVLFSPQYIEIILNNLLSNAFKYTKEQGTITVRIKKSGQDIVLEVEDTGKGIPFNLQEKIFDRFYQTSPDHTGSGIGLSLVKHLVDMHHGRVELNSEEGKGSCFRIFIPQNKSVYAENEFADSKDEEAERKPKTTEDIISSDDEIAGNNELNEDVKKGTILVVEDNVEILDYLKNELNKEYNVIIEEDGLPALEVLKDQDVDLVLTDVMLPEMSGIKLCKAIKQNIRTCHIPVVILSAKANTEDQLEGLEVGADDYITKPFSIAILLSKIHNILRSRKRMLDHYSNSFDVEPEKITFNAMDEELIRKATEIVKNNMDNIEFSADDFSREMAMSRSNLHLKLKAITGESTIEFIRKIRFNEACKLLKDGRYNISEVSTMVGFNSPSYFATSFKKYFGFLPTEYVKNLRK